jgi:hypothetical protein
LIELRSQKLARRNELHIAEEQKCTAEELSGCRGALARKNSVRDPVVMCAQAAPVSQDVSSAPVAG